MRRFDHYRDALRLEHLVERIGDLRRHLLLDLQPLGVDLDKPRQLRDADHPIVRQVGDVDLADDRRDVVLAVRFEADVLQHDDLVIPVHLLEGALQQRHRILVVAAEELGVRAHHPVRRAEQAFPLGVVAGPADQRADRVERLVARRASHAHRFA